MFGEVREVRSEITSKENGQLLLEELAVSRCKGITGSDFQLALQIKSRLTVCVFVELNY
jgi:hypothetical protein